MFYVALDCDKVQDYIYTSNRLRGIRNASRLLARAERHLKQLAESPALGGRVLRSLGGVVVARFPVRKAADSYLVEALKYYRSLGISAQGDLVELGTRPADFYKEVLTPLFRGIGNKKRSPQGVNVPIPSTILASTCDLSGTGGAQEGYPRVQSAGESVRRKKGSGTLATMTHKRESCCDWSRNNGASVINLISDFPKHLKVWWPGTPRRKLSGQRRLIREPAYRHGAGRCQWVGLSY